MGNTKQKVNSSFRDPDAFVFKDDEGVFYRQMNTSYQSDFELFISSGLYQLLSKSEKLISHVETNDVVFNQSTHYKTIKPEQLPFISYAYEWCFDQFKDAAMLTLDVLKDALDKGMILKDATHFNIQFLRGKPIFIDTSSFEKYEDGMPWIAYRQFCENFFGPLLLMKYVDPGMNKMLQIYPDGIPLHIVAKALPFKSKLNISSLLHVHFQSSFKGTTKSVKKYRIQKNRLYALIDNLYSAISKMKVDQHNSTWDDYYTDTILSKEYLTEKTNIVNQFINEIEIKLALDVGTNNGVFAQLLASKNIDVVAIDFDTACVNNLYNISKNNKVKNILPLCVDITSPTPSIGWNNDERSEFVHRNKFDLTMALALIHHLCISKNLPIDKVAQLFSSFSKTLIIEFVPKEDEKVQLLLNNREDIFSNYSQQEFETVFSNYFQLLKKVEIKGTGRVLYHFGSK